MYLKIIAKDFIGQFCYNFCLNDDVLNNVFSFLPAIHTECLLDIMAAYNKKYKNKKELSFLKNTNHALFSYVPLVIPSNYLFYQHILHFFIKLFKNDILNALKTPSITINENNTFYINLNNHIENKAIIIDINLHKDIRHNNEYNILFNINWKMSKLIYKILYQNKNKQYIVNNLLLYNSINELIKIQYYTKIKNTKNFNKKNEILTFLVIFINNFFTKLKCKYLLTDIKDNYYEINGINKTKLNLILNFKFFIPSLVINNIYNQDEFVHLINLYINDILTHILPHIL
jgi:hypothetical protein